MYTVNLPDGSTYGPISKEVLIQWAREGRIPKDATLTSNGNTVPVLQTPLAQILAAPPTIGGPLPQPQYHGDETVATVIPYRNKPALISYYLAIFGCLFAILIPLLGFAMPVAALILGLKGHKAARQNPKLHGKAHAIIGILGGSFGILLAFGNLAIFLLIIAGP